MTGSSSPFTFSVPVPSSSIASINYVVRVYDAAGNVTTSSTQTITVTDNDAPVLGIITGTTGTTGETTTVTVNATDNIAPTNAEINVNSTGWVAMTGSSSPFTYGVAVPSGSVASINYQVRVFDAASNVSTSGLQTITVTDNDAPSIDSITGTIGTTGENTLVTLNASDNIAPTSAQINVNGTGWVAMAGSSSPFTFNVPVPSSSIASIHYLVRVYDAAGNVTTSGTNTITVTDNDAPTSPTISINSGSAYTNATAVTLTLSALDNIAVTQMRFSNDGTSYAAAVAYATSSAYTLPSGDGSKTVYVEYLDAAGNVSAAASASITLDQTPPALNVVSPIDNGLYNPASLQATYSATDTNIVTTSVAVDGNTIAGHNSTDSLGALTDGTHTVVFTATDVAGNVTIKTRTIKTLNSLVGNPTIVEFTGPTTNGTVDDTTEGVQLSGINTTGPVTFTVATYGSNPAASGIAGIQAFGKYFDIQANDSANVTFPLQVRIYYTTADLAAAGLTEAQLDGLYFWNSTTHAYERYANSGANTNDVIYGGGSYAGYVYVNVPHLTPIVSGGDKTALSAPSNVASAAGNGTVTITYSAVSGASSYQVRYRKANTSDAYTTVAVASTVTNTTISGLTNGVSYEFGVASVDQFGNVSSFSTTTQSPVAPVVTSQTVVATTLGSVLGTSTAAAAGDGSTNSTTPSTSSSTPSTNTPASDSTGTVKGAETSPAAKNNMVVIWSIIGLIVVGTLGYFGYRRMKTK